MLNVIQYRGNQVYFQKLFGNSATKYRRGIVTKDLFVIQIESSGNLQVQVHKNTDKYEHIISSNKLKGEVADAISMDLVESTHLDDYTYVYTVLKTSHGLKALHEIIIKSLRKAPTTKSYYEFFKNNPGNCGDKIKATQMLLIVTCSEN